MKKLNKHEQAWGSPPDQVISEYISSLNKINLSEFEFNKFRQNEGYKTILEGGEKLVGLMHLDKLKQNYGDNIFLEINKDLDKFKENDIYGSPNIFEFEYFGHIAPTTIKYISDAIDIEKKLSQNHKIIVEIGGGFGGLLKTISVRNKFEKYILIDIPEALKLAETYLSRFDDLNNKIEYISTFDREKISKLKNIDLLIGVCSFSELSKENQKFYKNTLLKKSNNIFLVYNTLHVFRSLYYRLMFSLILGYNFKIEPFNNTKYLYFKKSKFSLLKNSLKLLFDEIREFILRFKIFLKRKIKIC